MYTEVQPPDWMNYGPARCEWRSYWAAKGPTIIDGDFDAIEQGRGFELRQSIMILLV